MKCRTVQHWMLTSPPGGALPKSLRRHLRVCARCRERHRELVQCEEALKAKVEPACAAGLQRFRVRLKALLPQEAEPGPPVRSLPILRRTVVYWAASILFFIGIVGALF